MAYGQNTVTFVTGASRGFGGAPGARVADDGFHMVLNSVRDAAAAAAVVGQRSTLFVNGACL